MSFYNERIVKAIRKARGCDGCGTKLQVGETALACSGIGEDGFWSATYHNECRKAEEGLNELHDVRFGDEWMPLSYMEWDDWPWLIEKFPTVAARMKITTERFDEVQAEREATRKAWAAIDAKRREQPIPAAPDAVEQPASRSTLSAPSVPVQRQGDA